MDSRVVLIGLLVLMFILPSNTAQNSPDDGFEYRLIIACPDAQGAACPILATDGADAMGDPSVAVDPFRPRDMIIGSLHGGGDQAGAPSAKSRGGQAFTTFTSNTAGANWRDSPFTPPNDVRGDLNTAYGEHPAVTITPYGQVFVGSLYSVPDSSGRTDYVVVAQKFRSIRDIQENQGGNGDYNSEFIGSAYPGSAIRQMWYLFNPVTDNMTMVWSEQLTQYSTSASGLPRVSSDPQDLLGQSRHDADLLAELRAEAPPAARDYAPMSAIGFVRTGIDLRDGYEDKNNPVVIGPCAASTNPVLVDGFLYVGCAVGDEPEPFEWDPTAQPGQFVLFRLHPDGHSIQYVGQSPLMEGNAKLGVRSDGRLALVTAGAQGGQVQLEATYGSFDNATKKLEWSEVYDYSDEVPKLPGFTVRGAQVQDMIYREYSGVVHLILKQNTARQPGSSSLAQPFEPTVHKSIIAIDEEHGFLYYHDLDIGNLFNRTRDSTLMQQTDAVFDDLADDFLQFPAAPYRFEGVSLGDTYSREFFAVGDFGTIIFAEIIEKTDLRFGAVAVTLPPPPPVPAPAPATVPVVAVAGALSASAMTTGAYVMLQKKAAVGAKKKR